MTPPTTAPKEPPTNGIHYLPAAHLMPHYARGQGAHAQCTRRTPRGRYESHVARRSAGGGHGAGANRRHSTRHGARGAAPRCEGHERHHGVKRLKFNTAGRQEGALCSGISTSPWIGRGSAFAASPHVAIPSNLFGLHLPVATSVRHFSLLSTTTRFYTALYYPSHPAVLSKHGH